MLDVDLREALIKSGTEAVKRDFSAINNEITRRKIRKLFHFTHSKNIQSIIEHGLQTKSHLNKNSIAFIDTDKDRLDGIAESISFSIGMPNTYLLSVKNPKFDQNLIILEIAANNLLTQPFAAFPSNAAKKNWFSKDDYQKLERYVGIRGLKGMYLNPKLRKECAIPSDQPTDVQAEVLFFETIASKTILRVHISKNFPENERDHIRSLISQGNFPSVHADCDCGIFDRRSGPMRIYSSDWENNGE